MGFSVSMLCGFLCCLSVSVRAQVTTRSHRMDRELHFSYDNDLYFRSDKYYSSGANIAFTKVLPFESRFYQAFSANIMDTSKVLYQIDYGHKIFTPHQIRKRNVDDFDRPYAGWHYLNLTVSNFPSDQIMNQYQVEIGMVGEKSGIGNFQEWWHEQFHIVQPRGWQYEIANEVVMNLSYHRMMSYELLRNVNITSGSRIKIGNGMNKLSQNLTLRYGKANPLRDSGYAGSRVSKLIPEVGSRDVEVEEGFIFYGITADYVLTNIFLEGSLFNDNSPHTEEVQHLVFTRRWGFMYTNYYTTFYFTIYRIGKDVIGGRVHRYMSLSLAFRF